MTAPRPNLTLERQAQGHGTGVTDPTALHRVAVLVASTTTKKGSAA